VKRFKRQQAQLELGSGRAAEPEASGGRVEAVPVRGTNLVVIVLLHSGQTAADQVGTEEPRSADC